MVWELFTECGHGGLTSFSPSEETSLKALIICKEDFSSFEDISS